MHFKWQIWDYLENLDPNFIANLNGVLVLNTPDSISLKIIKDQLLKKQNKRIIFHKCHSDITKNWLNEEFEVLSFFQKEENYFIHQASELNWEIIDYLSKIQFNDRFMILSFETQGQNWKKILGLKSFNIIEIESPKFWEQTKTLDFCADYFQISLSYRAKNWLLDAVENTLASFYQVCSLLKINYPDYKLVDIAEVQANISIDRLDPFQLASLISRKKRLEFFKKIQECEKDFDRMRDLFRFLQSHFIKLADLSFLKNKSKLSSYDKELQFSSQLWTENELFDQIKIFNKMEILAKQKSSVLWWDLKKLLLETEISN